MKEHETSFRSQSPATRKLAISWPGSELPTIRPECVVTSLLFMPKGVEMVPESTANAWSRVRKVLCYSFLILAVLCEGYTVLAIALDRFGPAWYRDLGWLLFIIPFGLAAGLLLIYANQRRVAFFLCTTSLSLYALLDILDTYQGHAERGDLIFMAGWLAFCLVGVVAARWLSRLKSVNRSDVQEYSS